MNKNATFLRWAGSKKKLIPKLVTYWDEKCERYIEPFMGSAALFFAIRPSKAILSDINSDLIEAVRVVRDHPQDIHNRLIHLPLGEKAYYNIRQQDTSKLRMLDRAARFIYLNRFCFNGLYRTNKAGKFNVPYAALKTGRLPTLEELKKASDILLNAEILKKDFEEVVQDVQSGDFIYMDPPYAVRNRRIFNQYGPDSFGIADLKRLSSLLQKIDKSGASFLVSYALCREAIDIFSSWKIKRSVTQRSVAGFSKHRRKAVEILISNRN